MADELKMNTVFSYNKYHVAPKEKRMAYGRVFDSKVEMEMYLILKAMEVEGSVSDVQLQRTFLLQEKYITANKKKVSSISYVCDFYFYDKVQRRYRVVDCKGMKTDAFRLKEKLFNCRYKNQGLFIEYEL